MARTRPRFRPGRILIVCILFLVLGLLLEMNRFLPGGWPGGGGEGGLRRTDRANLGDTTGPDRADAPDRLRMAPTDGRPPIKVPREGVVIEVRAPAGAWSPSWHFGVGDAGPEDHVREQEHGRIDTRNPRVQTDGFRVRTKAGTLRLHTGVATAEPGHWIVVVPGELPPRRRKQRSVTIEIRSQAEGRPGIDLTLADGTTQDRQWGRIDAPFELPLGREPFRVVPAVDSDAAGAGGGRWIGPRTASPVVLDVPGPSQEMRYRGLSRDRVVVIAGSAGRAVARFRVTADAEAPSEHCEPVILEERAERTDAGLSLRVPHNTPVDVLLDDGRNQPQVIHIEAGTGPVEIKPAVEPGRRLRLRIVGPTGEPISGATITALLAASPFQGVREAATDASGLAALTGLPALTTGIFVSAPGFATARVLLDPSDAGPKEIRMVPGLPLRVIVTNREGLPIEGAAIDLDPASGQSPIPQLPRAPGAAAVRDPSQTGPRGHWAIEGLAVGWYTLRIQAPGYERLTVHAVAPGQARTYFVTLLPKR